MWYSSPAVAFRIKRDPLCEIAIYFAHADVEQFLASSVRVFSACNGWISWRLFDFNFRCSFPSHVLCPFGYFSGDSLLLAALTLHCALCANISCFAAASPLCLDETMLKTRSLDTCGNVVTPGRERGRGPSVQHRRLERKARRVGDEGWLVHSVQREERAQRPTIQLEDERHHGSATIFVKLLHDGSKVALSRTAC